MANKRVVNIDPDSGAVEIFDDLGKNPDGTNAQRRWNIGSGNGGKQIEKMLPTFAATGTEISAGDKSAALDAINAQLAQLKS